MSATLLAAAAENREASPIGLVVILLLLVALVFLIRSMNKVPGSFSRSERRRGAPSTPAGRDPVREPEDQ